VTLNIDLYLAALAWTSSVKYDGHELS